MLPPTHPFETTREASSPAGMRGLLATEHGCWRFLVLPCLESWIRP